MPRKKPESDRLFAARMLYESIARFESFDDNTGMDVMLYWSGKLHETLKLQENYYETQSAQQSEPQPVGSEIQQSQQKNSAAKR